MKCLNRNKRTFYYSNLSENAEILDNSGNRTGEFKLVYTDPISCTGNISEGDIRNYIEIFGTGLTGGKIIVIDTKDFNMNDQTRFWIDVDTDSDYDFILYGFEKGTYSTTLILKTVITSHNRYNHV